MKKTLLALAVLAAAGSAQAGIELYNQDGVSVNLKGDIEITYQNSTTSSSMSQQIEDADFGFDVRYAVNDQVSLGAMWEFDGSESNNSVDTKNGDNYIAVYTKDFGSVRLGRTCTAIDDIGIGNDYQFGIDSFFSSDTFECQDEAVRYDYDNGMFYATLGYVQNKLGEDATTPGNGGTDILANQGSEGDYVDGYVGARFAGFDVKVAVADYDNDAEAAADSVSSSLFGLEAAFGGIENLNLSAGYYAADRAHGDDNLDNKTWALAADYTMGKMVFGTGYSASDYDSADAESTRWFVNAGYTVAPSTTVYVEFAGVDRSGNDWDDLIAAEYAKAMTNDKLVAIGAKASF
ncbi:porin [Vibrio diazotrophicus]|uniref:porin n=1 Tax=Vibrio diazotrophicus TaxID=685 RepID=UPI00142DD6CC|nr:porin [Vibrio diazotrophicus]NIY91561.1 porin [Vibrio diazotrophicus]